MVDTKSLKTNRRNLSFLNGFNNIHTTRTSKLVNTVVSKQCNPVVLVFVQQTHNSIEKKKMF